MLLPTRPEMEGKNRWQDKDTKGAFLIQGIIKSAREGDGFSEYWTNKPSIGRDAPKLSFNLVLDKYQWVVGTGFYIDDIDNELATLRSEREETMYGSLKTGVLFILVILGVTLAATVVIGNRVTRPLADAVAALNDIADGDGDLTQRLKVQSKDEVGQLAAAFNRFVERIQSVVSQVGETSHQLLGAVDRLHSLSEHADRQMQGHGKETDQVVTAVTEMSSTAQEVAASASNAASATSDAARESDAARGVVNSAIGSINRLVDEVHVAAGVIEQLAHETGKIGSVVEVIRGIADQTNLLALNAAIEAARAGEQGRGFAVVADEVRKLAGNTQQAVQNTQELIEKIRLSSTNAVNAITQSQQLTHQAVGEADLAEEALGSIYQAISTINDMTYQIASAAEEQSSVSETVSGNLSKTNALANDIAQDATETAKASQALRQAADKLQQLLGQFRLS